MQTRRGDDDKLPTLVMAERTRLGAAEAARQLALLRIGAASDPDRQAGEPGHGSPMEAQP